MIYIGDSVSRRRTADGQNRWGALADDVHWVLACTRISADVARPTDSSETEEGNETSDLLPSSGERTLPSSFAYLHTSSQGFHCLNALYAPWIQRSSKWRMREEKIIK
jgi:hypothetical protein